MFTYSIYLFKTFFFNKSLAGSYTIPLCYICEPLRCVSFETTLANVHKQVQVIAHNNNNNGHDDDDRYRVYK